MKKLLSILLAAMMVLALGTVAMAEEAPAQDGPALFVTRGISNKENKTDNEAVRAKIMEESGVNFDTVVVPLANWSEKLNVIISSGEGADAIDLIEDNGNWSKYNEIGAIQPLNELLEKYGQHLLEYFDEEAWACCTDSDGTIWAIPGQEFFSRGYTPVYREDWMEALGIESINTIEDLEKYLAGVHDNDLNGNGDTTDEIPYLPGYDSYRTTFQPIFCGFAGDRYLDEDGNVMPWYMHPNCWTMLEKAQEWYKAGYIYPEYLTTSYEQIVDLAAADRIAVFSGWYNDTIRPSGTLLENDPDNTVSWAALGNLLNEDGETTFWPSNPKNRAVIAITSFSTEPEAVIRLLDWMVAEDDNYMLMTYGIENDHWTRNEDGSYTKSPDADDRYLSEYQVLDWYDVDRFGDQYIEEDDWVDLQLKKLRDQINAMDCRAVFDYYVPYSLAGTDADFLTGDADTMISEMVTKIIYGEATEEDWNAAVQTAWETDGQVRSAVWTEQYTPYAR